MEDYPPVVSTKVIYGMDNSPVKRADILHHVDNITLTLYGNDVKEKSKQVYDLVKDSIDLENTKVMTLFVFDFYNLTVKDVNKMSMTYGLWEKRNTDNRVEKMYNFKIEHI